MIRAFALAACLLGAASARSGEAGPETEVPRVSGTGTATRAVPVDGIHVVFRIDTGAESFSAARQQADATLERIREHATRTGLPELEFRDEFQVLEPERSEKPIEGTRLRHQLAVTSQHVAPERLQAGVIALIEAGLSADERVRVAAVEAFVSADRLAEHREAALAGASADARASAERLAASMDASIGRPLELDWEFTGPPAPLPDVAAVGGVSVEKLEELASRRERFALERPFSSDLTYRAVVRASFELKPGAGSP